MKNDWKTNNFDFLRLALAVLVIYSHAYPLGVGSEVAEPMHAWTRGQMTGGAVAVDLFFVMSGFLIAGSAERSRSVLDFLKKRVMRIYPAFVVCALLMVAVVLPLSGGSFAQGSTLGRVGDFVGSTLRLRDFHYRGAFAANPFPEAMNGSLWSIQYEFWCYIGVALLFTVGLLRMRNIVAVFFLETVAVSVVSQVEQWKLGGKILGQVFGSPQLWARLLPLYMAGVVFYLFRDRIRLHQWGAAASVAALVGASFVPWGWTAIFPFAGTYLVFYLAFAPWLKLHRFGRFGDFSYGAYLYAFPIEQLLMKTVGHPVAAWALFLSALPLTLLAAVASWYGVERRFLRPGRRREDAVVVATAVEPLQHNAAA